jgi:hypothetical protein
MKTPASIFCAVCAICITALIIQERNAGAFAIAVLALMIGLADIGSANKSKNNPPAKDHHDR